MFKKTINSTLFILLFLLLITPLIHAQTNYYTGYLDLDLINIDNQKELKLKSDLSFYRVDSTNDNYFYELKYDSKQVSKSIEKDGNIFLDQSSLIKDKSRQKEFLYLKYNCFNLKYGEVNYKINNPIFASYYDKIEGIKTKYKRDDIKLNYIYSKNSYNTVRDIIINPDLTQIFLKHSNIKKYSENIHIKVLDQKNNLLEIVSLKKGIDYKMNYKEGKVNFNPLIFFANNLEYNYELTLEYKIKENITNDHTISKFKKNLTKNISLKGYRVNKKDKEKLTGLVLGYRPNSTGSINFEYQNWKQKTERSNISLDNGDTYFKNNIFDKKEKSYGLTYNKLFATGLLINGYSIKKDIANNLSKSITKEEHNFILDKRFNDKYSANLEYKHLENSLGSKKYSYKTVLENKINNRLSLNTKYKINHNSLLSETKRSLSNELELEYSENLVISWGILQNMVNNKDYYQASLKYRQDNKIFNYQNKVIDLENRLIGYKFQNKKFNLYYNSLLDLENNKKIKRTKGLKYNLNSTSSLGYEKNDYFINDLDKEEVYKYKLKINNYLELSVNQIEYFKNINNNYKEKRNAVRSVLNYNNLNRKISIRFENVKNKESTYVKKRINYKYSDFLNSSIYYSLSIKDYISNDLKSNIKEENKEKEIEFKYRPLNNSIYIYYNYLDKANIKTYFITQKKNLIKNYIKLDYLISDKVNFNISHNKLFEELLLSNSSVKNNIKLNRYTLSFKLRNYWTIDLEYRTLFDDLNNINDNGYLLGLDRQINDNLSLKISYNFTNFNNDITELTDDNKGLSLNLNYIW